MLPEPWVPLDMARAPEAPRWVVPDFLALGWLSMVHAKWGSGKSMLYQTLIGAAMSGAPWLGRDVNAVERVLVVDEENPADVVIARLKAAGYVHERDSERLLYFDQIGCRLGETGWNEQLLDAVDQFRPTLVVIDSMFAATTATWANETIMPLFRDVFRPMARRFDCAVWLNHHDKKAGGEIGERASGGDQWMAQVDRQIAVDKLAEGAEPKGSEDGQVRLGFPIRLTGGKSRQGPSLPETYVSIESRARVEDPDLPVRMWLDVVERPASEGGRDAEFRPTWYMDRAIQVVAAEPGVTFNGIYKAVGKSRGYLRTALDLLIDEGAVRVEGGSRSSQAHFITG